MHNDYFVSPIDYSNSIYLTYNGDQPFASIGSKTLVPGMASVSLPSAPPQDGLPRALVTEFLRLDATGEIGLWKGGYRPEAGPTGKRKNLYRTDPRSHYSALTLDLIRVQWHVATVLFEGKRMPMLWHSQGSFYNHGATMLAQQTDTVPPAYLPKSDSIKVCFDAYLVLSQMWKPYVDIRTTKYYDASDFEPVVRSLFKKWWHAVKINDGLWRLYADDWKELFFAKFAIPV